MLLPDLLAGTCKMNMPRSDCRKFVLFRALPYTALVHVPGWGQGAEDEDCLYGRSALEVAAVMPSCTTTSYCKAQAGAGSHPCTSLQYAKGHGGA